MTQNISDIMSKDVITINSDQSIQEAATLMKNHDIGSIPVVKNGELVGIITDRDITLRSTASGQDTHVAVEECMSTNLTVASLSTDPHEAANLMAQHQIRRLPVVDNGQIVGMVAIGDLAVENIYENEAGEALSEISEKDHDQL
ncbi:CBS domain-containing protein [Halalkalibacter akibai]|uniref:Putative signal-transduction protein with CBS domains n=1 Tax=Halalkalibacter akibai (strain ATCC 43226 / DSM 21942 / CIP 109018 / JCM 9157 / 1139) TaxID=1236973 RepID=W4QSJ5_HALA3|nr:CBS domain-containing protein [Halalkalibacter akibai]GAE34304.1 putative signal-transduction protein with CBS domains [Halalkalibacter akibai JCM 9157]